MFINKPYAYKHVVSVWVKYILHSVLRVFKLGSEVGHVTHHAQQLFKVKRSKVKVTKSRDVSADKNAITRQCTVISTSNFVEIIDVGIDACGILSRSVGQTNRK